MILHLNEFKRPKVVFGSSFLSNHVLRGGVRREELGLRNIQIFVGDHLHFWSPSD